MATGNESISAVYAVGKKSWPDVTLSFEAFSDFFANRAEPITHDLAAHGGDLYLAVACMPGDVSALRHFDDILTATAPSLRRYDSSDNFAAEAIQRVRIHLLVAENGGAPRIARYDGRASLRTWVGVCAMRTALKLLRTARNAREIATDWPDTIAALPTGQPELEAVRARYADIFNAAWRQTCAALPARQRTLLRMCFVEDCALDTIASTYAVHRVTVWRWLEEAKRNLLDGIRARLGETLSTSEPGTESLLELVQSQLDLGLSVLDT